MPEQAWNIHSVEPQILGQIVGHDHAVKQLQTAVDSCFADPGRPFPTTLIAGQQGSRSLLARVVARELAAPLVEIDGQISAGLGNVPRILGDLEEGDCLLVDDLDELPPRAQAVLYLALKYRRLSHPPCKDREPRCLPPLPRFTVVATVEHEPQVLMPLRRMFSLVCRLQPLGMLNVQDIVEQRARALRWELEPGVSKAIVSSAGCVPFDAIEFLDTCHRRSRTANSTVVRIVDVPSWFGGE